MLNWWASSNSFASFKGTACRTYRSVNKACFSSAKRQTRIRCNNAFKLDSVHVGATLIYYYCQVLEWETQITFLGK